LARVRFVVFFKPPTPRSETLALYNRILAMPLVDASATHFTAKEEVWNKEEPQTIAGLDNRNPYPDAVSVKARMVTDIPALMASIKAWPQVDSVKAQEDVNSFLQHAQKIIGRIGFVMGVILLLLSLVIVHHTIELTLYARRKEIDIMSLVGASPAIVALPFILEGALYGIIGGGIAFASLVVIYEMMTTMLKHDYGANLWRMTSMLQQGASALILAGIVLGIIGSALSVTKYMRRPRSKMTNA
jgi:cell division transport system permease protein